MNQRLTRRQFGQLVLAGSATAGFATFSTLISRTSAQTPAQSTLVILGVRLGSLNNNIDPESDANRTFAAPTDTNTPIDIDNPRSSVAPSATQKLELLSLDVVTAEVKPLPGNTTTVESGEQITGFTVLADGTFLVAVTPASTSKKGGAPTRLLSLGTSSKPVIVSGLKKQEALESLLVLNDGSLVGLVVRKDGTPPARLVDINPQTGEIISKNRINLPSNQRLSNLAQCPNGKLYTTSVERNGTTNLVQLDLGQKKPTTVTPLRFNNSAWNGGLQSLVCSSAGQLFAFGPSWHDTQQYVYNVDSKTGDMTQLPAFEVVKITIPRA